MCTELILAIIYFTTISFVNYLLLKLLISYKNEIETLRKLCN